MAATLDSDDFTHLCNFQRLDITRFHYPGQTLALAQFATDLRQRIGFVYGITSQKKSHLASNLSYLISLHLDNKSDATELSKLYNYASSLYPALNQQTLRQFQQCLKVCVQDFIENRKDIAHPYYEVRGALGGSVFEGWSQYCLSRLMHYPEYTLSSSDIDHTISWISKFFEFQPVSQFESSFRIYEDQQKAEKKAAKEAALRVEAEKKAAKEAALRAEAEKKAAKEAALRAEAEKKAAKEAALHDEAEKGSQRSSTAC